MMVFLRLRIVILLCNQILPACLLGSCMKEEMCNNAFSVETQRWHGGYFLLDVEYELQSQGDLFHVHNLMSIKCLIAIRF